MMRNFCLCNRTEENTVDGNKRRTRNTDTSRRRQTHGDKVTVRARLSGEFSGSPVELDHIFKLLNDKIASLEIRP
jgi:hypothetical protein